MKSCLSEEPNEQMYITVAYALTHPRAVMVMSFYTHTTLFTVETSRRSHVFTGCAPVQPSPCLRIFTSYVVIRVFVFLFQTVKLLDCLVFFGNFSVLYSNQSERNIGSSNSFDHNPWLSCNSFVH
jgi:hypothetical protein